ncbi:hypothetical protein [Clostridium felsineum]|uniref:Uncharacterized protein n=1 Tax=Clostridium felsineum TaxID=36839 RepID=A0A1S8L672_9CLOT|nr:hypothetical protein [Clostridium felsineum]URZ08489.1 hypothetical protein CLROS_038710 [Clostridium felsineum]URZ13520.1 hypothetical protein CROST_042860 [Clostridium felsineum]
MFICKSYINKPEGKIGSLEKINEEWKKYFVEVSEKNTITQLSNKLDLNYLGGAIYLKYGDEVILDFKLCDYVDQLWAYILNLVENFILTGESETLFPDQPAKIKFKKISDEYMIMVLETNTRYTWTLPSKEFLITLLNESEMFFKSITESLRLTEEHYGFEISKIQKLKEKIN